MAFQKTHETRAIAAWRSLKMSMRLWNHCCLAGHSECSWGCSVGPLLLLWPFLTFNICSLGSRTIAASGGLSECYSSFFHFWGIEIGEPFFDCYDLRGMQCARADIIHAVLSITHKPAYLNTLNGCCTDQICGQKHYWDVQDLSGMHLISLVLIKTLVSASQERRICHKSM